MENSFSNRSLITSTGGVAAETGGSEVSKRMGPVNRVLALFWIQCPLGLNVVHLNLQRWTI